MQADRIKLSSLKTYDDCMTAIERIESDPSNSYGDWYSGHVTRLKEGAKKKIAAIEKRAERIYFRDNPRVPASECPHCKDLDLEWCDCV